MLSELPGGSGGEISLQFLEGVWLCWLLVFGLQLHGEAACVLGRQDVCDSCLHFRENKTEAYSLAPRNHLYSKACC